MHTGEHVVHVRHAGRSVHVRSVRGHLSRAGSLHLVVGFGDERCVIGLAS